MNILKIYQIHNSDCKYIMKSFQFAKEHDFTLDDYTLCYECEVSIGRTLDDISQEFNIDMPPDFKGHPLDVSDILELNGRKWYRDLTGWFEI